MIEKYEHSSDYYLVTLIVDRSKSRGLIDAAVELGVKPTFITSGRGLMHATKVGFFKVEGISPSLDTIYLLVPKSHLDSMMTTLIAKGKLDHFGGGAIYANHLHSFWQHNSNVFTGQANAQAVSHDYEFQKDLVAITCISQRGSAEEIARGAMEAGSPSPTISFGHGHGIRDRLNFLLQLAINPKKELLEVVVGSAEADRIFEIMVDHGHLDQPAMGFIFTRPVEKGLINTTSWQNTTPYPATMEQIIKAIDQIQGNTNWRASGTVQRAATKERKMLKNLVGLNIIVKRGFSDEVSLAAMVAGAGGTSVLYANAFPQQKHEGTLEGSDEREIVSVSLGEAQVEKIVDAVTKVPQLQDSPVIMYTHPIPQALTYLK